MMKIVYNRVRPKHRPRRKETVVEKRTKERLIQAELIRLQEQLRDARNGINMAQTTLDMSNQQGTNLAEMVFLIPDLIATRTDAINTLFFLRTKESELVATIERYRAGEVSEDELIALEARERDSQAVISSSVRRVEPIAPPEQVKDVIAICGIGFLIAVILLVIIAAVL